jgi:hypothetical protein
MLASAGQCLIAEIIATDLSPAKVGDKRPATVINGHVCSSDVAVHDRWVHLMERSHSICNSDNLLMVRDGRIFNVTETYQSLQVDV